MRASEFDELMSKIPAGMHAPEWSRPGDLGAMSIRAMEDTLPMHQSFWTWREAMEVAVRAPGRASVRRQPLYSGARLAGHKWVASWREKPMLVNAS